MAQLDLTALANEASSQLAALWDTMGVGAEERGERLETLQAQVAALYASTVAGEAGRRAAIEAEIATLQTTIDNMIHAMEETGAAVVRARRGRENAVASGRRTPPAPSPTRARKRAAAPCER